MKLKLLGPLIILFLITPMINPASAVTLKRTPSQTMSIDKDDGQYFVMYDFSVDTVKAEAYDVTWKINVFYSDGLAACDVSRTTSGSDLSKSGVEDWGGNDFVIDLVPLYKSYIDSWKSRSSWDNVKIAEKAGNYDAYICTRFRMYFDTKAGFFEDIAIVRVYEETPVQRQFTAESYYWILLLIGVIIAVVYYRKPKK